MSIPAATINADTSDATKGIENGGIPTADNTAAASGDEWSCFEKNGISSNNPTPPITTYHTDSNVIPIGRTLSI